MGEGADGRAPGAEGVGSVEPRGHRALAVVVVEGRFFFVFFLGGCSTRVWLCRGCCQQGFFPHPHRQLSTSLLSPLTSFPFLFFFFLFFFFLWVLLDGFVFQRFHLLCFFFF